MVKVLVIIAFMTIVASLGSALFHLVKNKGEENAKKILKALTVRISLSVILLIFVVIAIGLGVVEPTGLGVKIHPMTTTAP